MAGLTESFNIEVIHETGGSFLTLRPTRPDAITVYNHQIEMLSGNPRQTIMPVEIRRRDDETSFVYRIGSMISLKEYTEGRSLSRKELLDITCKLLDTLLESKNLLLNETNYILNEEYIYIDQVTCVPCMLYLPVHIDTNADKNIKDFFIWIAAAYTPVAEDHSIQSMIRYVKSPRFNLMDFSKLIHSISLEDNNPTVFEKYHSSTYKNDMEQISGNVQVPDKQQVSMESHHSPGSRIIQKVLEPGGKKVILSIVLSQTVVIFCAIGMELLMKGIGIEIDTRYIIIALFVLVFDLLFIKYVLLRISGQSTQKNKDVSHSAMGKKPAETTDKMSVQKTAVTGKTSLDETTLLSSGSKRDQHIPKAFLRTESHGTVDDIEIDKDSFIIGRNPTISDLVIIHKAVGRVHAEITKKDGSYYLIDNKSRNGTYLNEDKLIPGQEYKLNNNDKIIFANTEYRFITV